MEFKTAISKIQNDGVVIREQKLSDLITNHSFSDTIFLLLRGTLPNEQESRIFGAVLTAVIDHGMGTTSALSSRFIASGGNSLNTAVGGGILSLGDYHGGAIEKGMLQIQEFSVLSPIDLVAKLESMLSNRQSLFGFGHKVYKTGDPRVEVLLAIMKDIGMQSNFVTTILEIEQLIEKIKGRKIVLNIDGLIAALLLEMNFPPEIGKGIFIIGRTPGLVAQVFEELTKEKPVRRLDEDQIKYDTNY